MAIVANAMPIDTFNVGDRVVWFDPTADVTGRKYGMVTAVTYGASGTDKPIRISVQPEAGGAVLANQDASLFRIAAKLDTVTP